jgi:hypothetical protein
MWFDLDGIPPAPVVTEPGDLLVINAYGRQVRYLVLDRWPDADGWGWTLDLLADPEDI